MDNLQQAPKLLTVEELSQIIRLSPGTIKNILSKNAKALPPRRIVAGSRAVLFYSEDVLRWMQGLPVLQGVGFKRDKDNKVVQNLIPVAAPGEEAQALIKVCKDSKARRGRPTKAMQLARQKEASQRSGRAS